MFLVQAMTYNICPLGHNVKYREHPFVFVFSFRFWKTNPQRVRHPIQEPDPPAHGPQPRLAVPRVRTWRVRFPRILAAYPCRAFASGIGGGQGDRRLAVEQTRWLAMG